MVEITESDQPRAMVRVEGRDIAADLHDLYGIQIGRHTISRVTDAVL